jgi:hypothetical protein
VVAAATSAQILPFFHNFNASRCVEERARSRTAGTDGDQHQACPPFCFVLPVYRRDPPWSQVRSIAAHASVKKIIVQKARPRGAAVPPRRRLSVAPATERHGAGPALAASRSGVRARASWDMAQRGGNVRSRWRHGARALAASCPTWRGAAASRPTWRGAAASCPTSRGGGGAPGGPPSPPRRRGGGPHRRGSGRSEVAAPAAADRRRSGGGGGPPPPSPPSLPNRSHRGHTAVAAPNRRRRQTDANANTTTYAAGMTTPRQVSGL